MLMNPQPSAERELYLAFQSRPEGLSEEEAKERIATYGRNALEEKKKTPLILKIWAQVRDPMVLVLVAAAVISGLLGELSDMSIIIAVVALNTFIGLMQESKAEKAIEALKKMSAQQARVTRGGKIQMLPAEELVPGDIVSLEAGDLVPADMMLLNSSNLKIEEASLTGESVPAEKDAGAAVPDGCPLGDRVNMAFQGTSVTYGHGRGVVSATGMKTEMGRIADIINRSEKESTPLQKKLAEIGKLLTVLVIGICVVIFFTGVIKSGGFTPPNILQAFLISVSLAVAAIPEGLPAVVTIVMALGVTRMARRRAIIKKLPAVETLGCAQIICSDKTGTLTQNKMDVREVFLNGRLAPGTDYLEGDNELFANILYLCNDSTVTAESEIGDPTETALKRFVLKKYDAARFAAMHRVTDLPFDSERKMMSTVNETPQGVAVFTKGAPDELLRRCTRILLNGETLTLTDEHKNSILNANRLMAEKALRVLGTAFKPYREGEELEEDLVFVGLVGMIDPPRPEAYEAIEKCRRAGITPIMITGDHRDTAVAIAREIGIITDPSQAVFGSELDSMDDAELDRHLDNYRVYARVSPEHKVRIVEAWRRRGKIVAMTGDGVNDAPALKKADIGVGMGITGTDVSKGVSDMLLADDNFATIVNAVEEGRKIYSNVRKAVQFLLSSNISEVIALFAATLMLPPHVRFLGAVHILWINLITDSIPAIGLGVDKAEKGIMNDPPRDSTASFFAGGLGFRILYQGIMMAALTVISYFIGYQQSEQVATTMAFITLSGVELFYSFGMKMSKSTIFSRRTFDNPVLLLGAVIPLVLLIVIVCVPPIGQLFSVVPLTLFDWLSAFGLAFLIIPFLELVKLFRRLFHISVK